MAQMTSRQRLLAAIDGEPVDRIPVAPRVWRYAVSKGLSEVTLPRTLGHDAIVFPGGLGNPINSGPAEDYAELLDDVQIETRKERQGAKTVIERTFRTPAGALHDKIVQPDAGGEYGVSPNAEWLEPLVKTAEDAECVPYLLPDARHAKPGLAHAREMEAELGDYGVAALRPTIGIDNLVVDLLGTQGALVASLDQPELFARLLDITDAWHTAVMTEVLEGGWKIIFDVWFNFSLSMGWSPTFYRETAAPRIRKHAELIHSYGAKLFFYDDGKLTDSIGCVIDAGADMIQTISGPPSGDLDYEWLAGAHGGRACFNGGVDTVRMRFAEPEEIVRLTRHALDTLAPTGRFILGTSDSIPEGTPEANIRAFLDTAREHGTALAKNLYGAA